MLVYEGKAKRLYETEDEHVLLVEYKDSATAFNGVKKAEIDGKGQLNNEITSLIFQWLDQKGVKSHFIRKVSEREQLVKRVTILPVEVVLRNVVAGSMAKRLGLEEGTPLLSPIVEFYYKNDDLGDPIITEDHALLLEIASEEDLQFLREQALIVNQALQQLFSDIGVRLIDFKLEFGRDEQGSILLADEISPDTCRLWDKETNQKLDKDVFRRDLGNLTDVYQEILKRLRGEISHV
ncbi:phosphoribosylaminoimidazolesuccinocarboxamide synthase [Heyndrickxia ginsengihumi]|uniref:Phosphoribosylaminoimidazole-succinocarboxamide synthase n=1 Tax=Heyndrickxia ginsengihumi TaxID=363870 RepID=A0A0A6VFN4_9BACI|nr:phosphoribosylaminoimidazolesuccinocarboxamide synthase [Heyndrickxia ginsengihumi]KHD85429.1 phosphoribosylaminoimidazole-succinocarboxamide synthase [Heyndrickxia ginsengihumi]MBE6183823.1 phosphoribosylaminoimidazolesuccinocarboxamide synthase [Bacillus sp. (in: firmicutes)]MCM3023763.1 phosphoribosylaminoimidazolesuccinocarboxamide synthase [Heyndrickxia ginsengihumi]NEY21300.1 phosphoribosylaminoimidazolesuccinocarboxamide synthase [Heyndrickxia ginsengihumi]